MRALIVATGYQEGMHSLLAYRPTPLLRIVDKPIICHIVEQLTCFGIKELDLILHHLPEMIEKQLGDGSRWGVAIRYHLCRDLRYPFETVLSELRSWKRGPFLLGCGDRMPEFESCQFEGNVEQFIVYPSKEWTGWAVTNTEELLELPVNVTLEEFSRQMAGTYHSVIAKPFLSVRTLLDWQKSNEKALSKKITGELFPSSAQEVKEGLWLSHGVKLHPSAKMVPPLFIGENCQIGEEAHLGPYTVVENHCIIDSHVHAERSLICRSSYLGEGLELHNSIVDRNLLISLDHEAEITLTDEFMLSDAAKDGFWKRFFSYCERGAALVLVALASPLLMFLLRRYPIERSPRVALPSAALCPPWRTFAYASFELPAGSSPGFLYRHFHKLPALFNIVKGELHFVGVGVRTPEELEKLPEGWRRIYLKSKAGLITLAELDNGASDDERYASEAYYIACGSDLALFARWIVRRVSNFFRISP